MSSPWLEVLVSQQDTGVAGRAASALRNFGNPTGYLAECVAQILSEKRAGGSRQVFDGVGADGEMPWGALDLQIKLYAGIAFGVSYGRQFVHGRVLLDRDTHHVTPLASRRPGVKVKQIAVREILSMTEDAQRILETTRKHCDVARAFRIP